MHLSRLLLDPRLPSVRRDLADPYEMHRTVWRAFPEGDPGRILFRVEAGKGTGPVEVLVQSDKEPNWQATGGPGYLVRAEQKEFSPEFQNGQKLRFRLRANPTKRVHSRNERLGSAMAGKRVGVRGETALLEWIVRKGGEGGFRLPSESPVVTVHIAEEGRLKNGKPGFSGAFDSVIFNGILEVTDSERFLKTIADGIGTAKGYGFGLLTVAPTISPN